MKDDIDAIIASLQITYRSLKKPIVTELVETNRNPYHVLISTVISLRTKDEVTRDASRKLFERAGTPYEMVKLSADEIAQLIYPAGFYRNKAKTIRDVSRTLIDRYGGIVPDDIDDLLKLKGIGRKTANLVLTLGYDKDGICVDTHVHRIMNRIGYVVTKTPDETEFALREKLPKQYWKEINSYLVAYGQYICKPVSPLCSQCPIHAYCHRVGVTLHR